MRELESTERATESGLLLTTIPTVIQTLGGSPESVLRRGGLPPNLFSNPPEALTPTDYFALWSAIDEEVESVANGPLPLRMVELVGVENFDPMIFAFLNSADVKTGIVRTGQFKAACSASRVIATETGSGLTIEFQWPAPHNPPPVVSLTGLVYGVWLIRLGTRAHVKPIRVTSPDLPKDANAYEKFFGVPITCGPVHRMEFSPIDVHRPLVTANDAVWQVFEPALRKRLAEIDTTASTQERVRAALVELLPAGDDSLEAVARSLAVSARTLQRQLQAEGTTYKHVLRGTREQLAMHYLRQSHLSNAQIAFLLAYSDVRSFNRAFESWTGMSPKQVRMKLVA